MDVKRHEPVYSLAMEERMLRQSRAAHVPKVKTAQLVFNDSGKLAPEVDSTFDIGGAGHLSFDGSNFKYTKTRQICIEGLPNGAKVRALLHGKVIFSHQSDGTPIIFSEDLADGDQLRFMASCKGYKTYLQNLTIAYSNHLVRFSMKPDGHTDIWEA